MKENNIKSREIDVIAILSKVLAEKKHLFWSVSISAVIGVVVALNTPKSYTSSAQLAPESYDMMSSSSLGGMASALGISIGATQTSDAIYPELYPDLFASTDFQISLFDIPVSLLEDSKSRTYYDHIIYDTPIPFWKYPVFWVKEFIKGLTEKKQDNKEVINPFMLTKQQHEICEALKSLVTCVVDKKTSVITISVTDSDPLVAATINDTLMARLQKYITDYRTKKARHDMDYYERLTAEAYDEYIKASERFSEYADSHTNSILSRVTTKQEQMENDMALKYQTYSTFNTQLQASKAKVQECTPVFTVIQRPTVPVKASSMPRVFIVLFYMFVGFIFHALWVLYLCDFVRCHLLKKRNKTQCMQ